MNSDGSDQIQLTFDPLNKDQVPDWSPDGSRIAYSADLPDGSAQIFVMDADGSGVVQLTSDQAVNFAPAWSPDGTQIAFVKEEPNGTRDVWVMDVEGPDAHRLAAGAGPQYAPAWQPRGKRVP